MRLVALALLAAIFFVLAKIVITLTNPETVWTTQTITGSGPVAATQNSQSFTFQSDPFNSVSPDVTVEEVDIDTDVPETTLNLKMTGRIAGEQGSAILRTADNKEAVYKIGDEVISDVVLKRVKKDYVVLSVNGQLQRLTFEQEEFSGFANKNVNSDNAGSDVQPSSGDILSSVSEKSGRSPEEIVGLLQNISLKRSVSNGKYQGLEVRPNRPGIDITQFGLKKGDIVTQVAGRDIKSREDFFQKGLRAFKQGNSEITVLRNGQSQKIQLGAN